ncbi:uncharacterized protein AB9W97_006437 isoform 2-T4 [Spinachia spinachia]
MKATLLDAVQTFLPCGNGASPGSTQMQLKLVHPLSAKRKEDITKGIVDYIAQDMRPINTVEGEGFKKTFKIVEPRAILVLEFGHQLAGAGALLVTQSFQHTHTLDLHGIVGFIRNFA